MTPELNREYPELDEEDIRGDLHMHTTASDGKGTIREMAEAVSPRSGRDDGRHYRHICLDNHCANGWVEAQPCSEWCIRSYYCIVNDYDHPTKQYIS